MDERSKACAETVEAIIVGGAYKATKYLNEKLTVKATRKRFDKKILKRGRIMEIVLTIGGPNYEEREKIRRAKKERERLDLQVKYLTKPKGGR